MGLFEFETLVHKPLEVGLLRFKDVKQGVKGVWLLRGLDYIDEANYIFMMAKLVKELNFAE